MNLTIIALSLTVLLLSSVAGMIEYTDPEGDTGIMGMDQDAKDNVDIIKISIDTEPDPMVITLQVKGKVTLEENGMDQYTYAINLEIQDEEKGGIVLATGVDPHYSNSDGYYNDSLEVTGLETSTVTILLSKAQVGGQEVTDISASAMVSRYTEEEVGLAGDDAPDDADETDDDTDTDTDTDTDDDYWDDDWESSWDDNIPDPLNETPTDDSIQVGIDDVSFKYDRNDDFIEMEQKASGTTTGEVDHCSYTFITYYKDGTYEADSWTEGPEENPRQSFMGMTFEDRFKGKGSGGDDDWSTWEFYMYVKAPSSMSEDMEVEDLEDLMGEEGNISRIVFVVRAFGDSDETLWNQDSYDITDDLRAVSGSEDDDSLLPAPGAGIILLTMGALMISAIIMGRRKRAP